MRNSICLAAFARTNESRHASRQRRGDLVLLVPRHNQWNAAAESRPPSFPSSSVKSVKSVVFCWPSLRFPAHYSPPDQFRFLEVQEQRHLHAGDVQIIELRPSGSRGRSIATGGATIVIVGLPDAAVEESRDRVGAPLTNSGFKLPMGRPTLNLAQADVKKVGKTRPACADDRDTAYLAHADR